MKPKILIVSSDRNFRRQIVASLASKPVSKILAKNVIQAFGLLFDKKFDLAVFGPCTPSSCVSTFQEIIQNISPGLGVIVTSLKSHNKQKRHIETPTEGATSISLIGNDALYIQITHQIEKTQLFQKDTSVGNSPQYPNVIENFHRMIKDLKNIEKSGQILNLLAYYLPQHPPRSLVSVLIFETQKLVFSHNVQDTITSNCLKLVEQKMIEQLQNLGQNFQMEGKVVQHIDWPLRIKNSGASKLQDRIITPLIHGSDFLGLVCVSSKLANTYSPVDRYSLSRIFHFSTSILLSFLDLRKQATIDSITGLYNRTRVQEEIKRTLALSRRYRISPLFMMIDVDNFKEINDEFGHLVGDQILRELGELITSQSRETDFVGRFGGDEIIIILPESDLDAGNKYAQRLLEGARKKKFGPKDSNIQLTISIGIAQSQNFQKEFTEEMAVNLADSALFQAKQKGKDQVFVIEDRIVIDDDS